MTDMPERLRALFAGYVREPSDWIEVKPSDPGKFIVLIVSSAFEGVPEETRLIQVWQTLIDEFGDSEYDRVEYVFTDTPAEVEEARREAAERAGSAP